MAEPNTVGIAATSTTLSFGAIMLGLDVEAIIGALAGATIFVTHEKELNLSLRIVYLIISVLFGYYIAPEIIAKTIINSSAFAGFLGGLLTVTAGQIMLKQMQNTDLSWLLKRGGGK